MTTTKIKRDDVFSASDAKNRFGQLLDAAQRRPVTIMKQGRPVAVLFSIADYEAADDAYWGKRAMKALKDKDGFLSAEESEKYLQSVLHAKDRPTSRRTKVSSKTSAKTRKANS